MKNGIYFICALFLFVFSSCEVGDMEIKKLNRGEGIWEITGMQYQNYDSLGQNVVTDSTISDIGELVFFKSQTIDALFNYYLVVANMKDANGNITGHPGYIFFDGNRVSMKEDGDPNHSFPDGLEGIWTVTDSGRKKQEWTMYLLAPNGNLAQKVTIKLKKK